MGERSEGKWGQRDKHQGRETRDLSAQPSENLNSLLRKLRRELRFPTISQTSTHTVRVVSSPSRRKRIEEGRGVKKGGRDWMTEGEQA